MITTMTGGGKQAVRAVALGGVAVGSAVDSNRIAVAAIVAGVVVAIIALLVGALLMAGLVSRHRRHALAVLDRLVEIIAVVRTGRVDVAEEHDDGDPERLQPVRRSRA